MNWTKVALQWHRSVPAARPFNPVALLVSAWASDTEQGSGFFVHPAVLVTAAHVVAADQEVAARISVDCGSRSAVVAAVALPEGYLQGSAGAPDIAVAWLGESLCAQDQTLIVSSMQDGSTAAATLLGWGAGAFGRRDVLASSTPGRIRYAVENLPGFSGGPLLVPRTGTGSVPRSVGVHYFHGDDGGSALPLDGAAIVDAMRLFGFSFG